MDGQRGFTLMELLAALAILAVLAGLAVPALHGLVLDSRRTAAMGELARAVWYARVEATQRGRPVELCASSGSTACDGGADGWGLGWRVAPTSDPGEALRIGQPAPGTAVLLANRATFRFEPHDRRSTNGTIAWCDPRGPAASRALVISPTGRPRIQPGSGALECPAP
jgi:type IV fimbrial biogenesis protein FimT